MSHEAGELIWKLKADVSELEKALGGAEGALQKTSKKGGGFLDVLTSKWTIAAGVATGAAYAMIRASPSLSFAMEEIGFRFEEMLAILGEEFAPLLEEIVIPALDAFLPIVADIAPTIGAAVDAIVTLFKSEEAQTYIGGVVDSLERIGNAVWDIVEPALRAIWNLFEIVGPPILVGFGQLLEWIADIMEAIGTWIQWVSGLFEGRLTAAIDWIADKFLWLKENVLDPIVAVFKEIWNYINTAPVETALEAEARQIAWNIGMTGGTSFTELGPGIPHAQAGGYVARGGLAVIHQGETVLPAGQTYQTAHVSVEVHIGPVALGSELDIRTLAERVSQELRTELGRSVWG